MIIPPSAFSAVTAISTVGVVARPKSITSKPIPIKFPTTIWCTISPEMRASLPTTIFFASFSFSIVPNAKVNFAMSIGVKASPDFPPIVPRMPDIDFINDKV